MYTTTTAICSHLDFRTRLIDIFCLIAVEREITIPTRINPAITPPTNRQRAKRQVEDTKQDLPKGYWAMQCNARGKVIITLLVDGQRRWSTTRRTTSNECSLKHHTRSHTHTPFLYNNKIVTNGDRCQGWMALKERERTTANNTLSPSAPLHAILAKQQKPGQGLSAILSHDLSGQINEVIKYTRLAKKPFLRSSMVSPPHLLFLDFSLLNPLNLEVLPCLRSCFHDSWPPATTVRSTVVKPIGAQRIP